MVVYYLIRIFQQKVPLVYATPCERSIGHTFFNQILFITNFQPGICYS